MPTATPGTAVVAAQGASRALGNLVRFGAAPVVEGGTVVEEGRFEELASAGGPFVRLCEEAGQAPPR
ncbi:hypothetical protein ACFWMQ_02500 [Streptomyces sp. NPDC058372]|uniref:hypothetical protein n=1 Tax=Streptomyces sp. NPDC058372 TaxID=3346464 RepID=UPI0036697FE1